MIKIAASEKEIIIDDGFYVDHYILNEDGYYQLPNNDNEYEFGDMIRMIDEAIARNFGLCE